MLTVNNLSKRFGDSLLFEHVSFSINPGDRVGLIGPNGSGKTTLLRVLAGEDPQENGSLALAPGVTVGYLRQGFSDIPDGTLADLVDIPTRGLIASQQALDKATRALADLNADSRAATDAYEQARKQFESLGGYAAIDGLEVLLDRLGVGGIALERPLDELSGGTEDPRRVSLVALLTARSADSR